MKHLLAILCLVSVALAQELPPRPPEPKPGASVVSPQWYQRAELLESLLLAERAIVKVTSVAVETSGRAILDWQDNSDNEAGFIIERSTDGQTFVRHAEVGIDVTTFEDAGLAPGTYWYRVRAVSFPTNTVEWSVP